MKTSFAVILSVIVMCPFHTEIEGYILSFATGENQIKTDFLLYEYLAVKTKKQLLKK